LSDFEVIVLIGGAAILSLLYVCANVLHGISATLIAIRNRLNPPS
jgi:hypothetical protein